MVLACRSELSPKWSPIYEAGFSTIFEFRQNVQINQLAQRDVNCI